MSEVEKGEDYIEDSRFLSDRKNSPEKLYKHPGAEIIYDKDMTVQEYKMKLRA